MNHRPNLISTPLTAESHGALELEQTPRGVLPHRLPAWAREYADGQLAMAEAQPSGVRLARSRATYIRWRPCRPSRSMWAHHRARTVSTTSSSMAGRPREQPRPAATSLTIDLATGTVDVVPGTPAVLEFGGLAGDDKEVEVWLPWNERTELVALWTDAPVERPPDRGRPGGCTTALDQPRFQRQQPHVHVAGRRGVPRRGRPGQPRLRRQRPARPLRRTRHPRHQRRPHQPQARDQRGQHRPDASARLRAGGPQFLDTIREGHPTRRCWSSPRSCAPSTRTRRVPARWTQPAWPRAAHLRAAGDAAEVATGKLTLQVIREELARIVKLRATEDPHLGYLDGLELYGASDTPSGLCPTTSTRTRRLSGAS